MFRLTTLLLLSLRGKKGMHPQQLLPVTKELCGRLCSLLHTHLVVMKLASAFTLNLEFREFRTPNIVLALPHASAVMLDNGMRCDSRHFSTAAASDSAVALLASMGTTSRSFVYVV